ncbi:MAG: hypothetical protein CM15mV26_0130 [uncultured marine virus]|nr:MAG: hypothetical protein CM15mV26_0130 [uncultured marine virus]
MVGDNFLVRGYDRWTTFHDQREVLPDSFVPTSKKMKYKTPTGDNVDSVNQVQFVSVESLVKKYDGSRELQDLLWKHWIHSSVYL